MSNRQFVTYEGDPNDPSFGGLFPVDPANAAGIAIPSFRIVNSVPQTGAITGEAVINQNTRQAFIWDGAKWVNLSPSVVASYPTEAALLADRPGDGSYGFALDTGNLFIRVNGTWKMTGILEFANEAAVLGDTVSATGQLAVALDTNNMFVRTTAGWKRILVSNFPNATAMAADGNTIDGDIAVTLDNHNLYIKSNNVWRGLGIVLYNTDADLTGDSPQDGTVALALDSGNLYGRAAGAWKRQGGPTVSFATPMPTSLQAGDFWVEGNQVHVMQDATTPIPIGHVHTSGATAPPNPIPGTIWVDTSGTENVSNVWDGTAWVVMTGVPQPVIVGNTAPATPVDGMLWVDPTGTNPNPVQVYANGGWQDVVVVNMPVIDPPVTVSVNPPATPDVGDLWLDQTSDAFTLFQRNAGNTGWTTIPMTVGTQPVAPATNDYWYDTANKLVKQFDGASWNTMNATQSSAEPDTPAANDLWAQPTNSDDLLKVWDGQNWVHREQDMPVKVAPSTTAPVNPVAGSVWIDNTDPTDLIMKVWDGGAWQEVSNAQVSASPTTVKGDIIVRGDTGDQRLAIGTPGQMLAVNNTADGLQYVAAPTGGGGGGPQGPTLVNGVARPGALPAKTNFGIIDFDDVDTFEVTNLDINEVNSWLLHPWSTQTHIYLTVEFILRDGTVLPIKYTKPPNVGGKIAPDHVYINMNAQFASMLGLRSDVWGPDESDFIQHYLTSNTPGDLNEWDRPYVGLFAEDINLPTNPGEQLSMKNIPADIVVTAAVTGAVSPTFYSPCGTGVSIPGAIDAQLASSWSDLSYSGSTTLPTTLNYALPTQMKLANLNPPVHNQPFTISVSVDKNGITEFKFTGIGSRSKTYGPPSAADLNSANIGDLLETEPTTIEPKKVLDWGRVDWTRPDFGIGTTPSVVCQMYLPNNPLRTVRFRAIKQPIYALVVASSSGAKTVAKNPIYKRSEFIPSVAKMEELEARGTQGFE